MLVLPQFLHWAQFLHGFSEEMGPCVSQHRAILNKIILHTRKHFRRYVSPRLPVIYNISWFAREV